MDLQKNRECPECGTLAQRFGEIECGTPMDNNGQDIPEGLKSTIFVCRNNHQFNI